MWRTSTKYKKTTTSLSMLIEFATSAWRWWVEMRKNNHACFNKSWKYRFLLPKSKAPKLSSKHLISLLFSLELLFILIFPSSYLYGSCTLIVYIISIFNGFLFSIWQPSSLIFWMNDWRTSGTNSIFGYWSSCSIPPLIRSWSFPSPIQIWALIFKMRLGKPTPATKLN